MTEDVYSFANDIDWFVKHIGSRKHVLPTFAHAASTVTENTNKTLNKFIEDHAYDKVYEDGKLKSYGVPEEYVGRHRVLVRSLRDMILFADLLPKMTLVSLISLFDGFLARLLSIKGLIKN